MSTIPDSFSLAKYRLTLAARDPISLPPFKGSALRGGFGASFKRMVCFQPQVESCQPCLLRHNCPYAYLFESFPALGSEALSKNESITRPMVIEPPLDQRTIYEPGDTLTFNLILIGRAVQYLAYFTVAFQQLGRTGLGRGRGKFRVSLVEALHPFRDKTIPVYQESDPETVQLPQLAVVAADIENRVAKLPVDQIQLNFLTPTRLKHQKRWVRQGPPFDALVKVLLGRVSSLSYFYCGERLEVDFRGLIDRAARVQIAQCDTRWEDWSRFSGRQRQWIEMGGLVGHVIYEGDLRGYLPLLALGELVHVGKGTVFGNGQYRVLSSKD